MIKKKKKKKKKKTIVRTKPKKLYWYDFRIPPPCK